MAPISLYDVYDATFLRSLKALATLLDEAVAHAAAKGLNPDDYVSAALIDDMKPLSFQVQVCSNVAKLTVRRIRGPADADAAAAWPDDETTLAALQARVQKTLALAATLTADELAGKDDVLVESPIAPAPVPLREYFFTFAVPNMFFHLQTAYAILRARGVPLGKKVYLKSFAEAEK